MFLSHIVLTKHTQQALKPTFTVITTVISCHYCRFGINCIFIELLFLDLTN